MRKLFSFFAAMLVAVAVNAAPVVLPATLDVTNVSFRSEGMPDFVVAEGDYAGTYFDMGAHDSSNDTLLYAEWDVTIEPIIYTVAADLYNPNGWMAHIELLDQNDQVLKVLRFTGSWGKSGQFAAGAMDLRDLAAGNYKVRARAAVAWSQMKLKDLIFTANYSGTQVALPGTLLPIYAELSSGASVANDAIVFNPGTANSEYANWNVSFAQAGTYNVTIDMTASNGHTYGVALLSADGATQIDAVAEAQSWDTGVKELGAIAVPAAGTYKVKLTNATQWSEAVLNSITFAAPAPAHTYTVAGDNTDVFGTSWDLSNTANDMTLSEGLYKWEKANLTLGASTIEFKVVMDRDWNDGKNAWPSDNYKLIIPEDGIYTITITFNEATKEVKAVATKTGSAVVIPTIAMHGNFLGSWADTQNFTVAEGDATASLKLNLAAGNYEFGMRIGSSGNWTSNGVAFTRENNAAEVVAGQGNLTLAADVAGEYTFTWTYATNTLAITFPDGGEPYVPTLANGYYLVGKIGGVDKWSAADLSADLLFARYMDNTEQEEYKLVVDLTEGDGIKVVKVENDAIVTWYIDGMGNEYVIDKNHAGAGKTVWFRPNKDGNEDWVLDKSLYVAPNGPTAIDNVEMVEKAVKLIENGQLFIIKNGVKYNVLGAAIR